MKKLLSLFLVCVMIVTLVACGDSNTDQTKDADQNQKEENKGEDADTEDNSDDKKTSEPEDSSNTSGEAVDLNVGVFYYTYSDTYISSVRIALDKAFADAGIKVQNFDGNNNQTNQNEQIDTAISQGVNLLIVNIVTSGSVDSSQAIVEKAKAAGIPVIFFNRAVEGTEEEGKVLGSYDKCAFVGTDAPEAGHMQGQMIGEYVVENFDKVDLNGDGKISYAMFMGQLGNVEAIYRTQYAVEDANKVLTEKGKPELEYFDSSNSDHYQVDQDGNWSSTAANTYMNTNLSQYSEANGNMIELIICNNDGMAEGAISALNDKGYNLGTDDCVTIPVFGVDATDAAKQLINNGKMTGTIKQDAEGMANAISYLAKNVADGKELMADTNDYNISENVSNKIYIPYASYTGE